jgi:hypothetical protein
MNKSRFAILAEEFNQPESNKNNLQKSNRIKEENIILNKIADVNTTNTFKQNYNERRLSNSEYIRVKDNESKIKKEQEKKKWEEDKKQSLSKENFPELSNTLIVKHKDQGSTSFIHKLNEKVKSELVENESETESGWVKIRYDTNMSKIVMIFDENDKDIIHEQSPNTEDTLCNHNTMMALADLHKRRTEEYIELWGKEDWEKYFLFANDEYNYLEEEEYEDDLIDSPDFYFDNDSFIDDLDL